MLVFWQRNESGRKLPRGARARAALLLKRVSRATQRAFGEVGVTYVTPAVSRQLNHRYRRHNWVTDVLSFTYHVRPIDGELTICLTQAERQARRFKHSLATELDRLLVHGFLHLAGHDHIKKAERTVMRSLEDRVLKV
jgi:probable rRNA maturation factor